MAPETCIEVGYSVEKWLCGAAETVNMIADSMSDTVASA